MRSTFLRPVALRPLTCLLALLLPLVVPLATGCGDDAFDGALEGSGAGGGDHGGPTGTVGSGPGADSAMSAGTGSGEYTGSGGGMSGAGGGSEGESPPPSPVPPEEEPEDVTCADLDPGSPLVLYLSADDSNSMASPAEAREAIRAGGLPASVRTFEFLNYYQVDFPAPAYPDVGLFAEAEAGDEPGTFDLLLAVRAHDAPEVRRPTTVTFVLDTSGSMDGAPMDRQRAAIRAIAGQLREGDIASVVTWNTQNIVRLSGHAIDGPNDALLLEIADELVSDGGTDLNSGLAAGYQLAVEHYGATRLNRVVVISDGGANVGVTEADLIGLHSDDADAEGIYLVGVGTGPLGFYNDALMDTVTDAGRGAYVYLDSTAEAERVFGARFDETMEIAARAVQVEVTLPWYFQMKAFYGEEWSENPDEVEPQHLAPGDATVILQTLKACSPDVIDPADPVRLRVRWQTPLGRQDRETAIETTIGALLEGDTTHLAEAEAIVAYAEALKTGASADLAAALGKVEALADRADPDLEEIGGLLRAHPAMAGQ